MIRVGLTGSIAMGKSTTAEMFRALGAPVHDADAAVHALYAPGGAAVAPVRAAFGAGVIGCDGGVDRLALRAALQAAPEGFKTLERLVHPLVAAARVAAEAEAEAAGAAMILLDVPLLFETGLDRTVDAVVVVSADPATQRARALARPGMTPEALDAILARQIPDAEKRRRASHVIDTTHGLEAARAQVQEVHAALRAQAAAARTAAGKDATNA
ncbi:MAG: dephospho-CoA kinase [Pseudomonadota bacterium]